MTRHILQGTPKVIKERPPEVLSFNFNDEKSVVTFIEKNYFNELESITVKSKGYLQLYKKLKEQPYKQNQTWNKLRSELRDRLSKSTNNKDRLGALVD